MWTEPTANGVQLLKCFDCSEELKLASCLCICASCLYSSLCPTAPLRVLHVMSPAPASYLRPTPLCDRHLPASHVIIPSFFFSLSLSLSLSLSCHHPPLQSYEAAPVQLGSSLGKLQYGLLAHTRVCARG